MSLFKKSPDKQYCDSGKKIRKLNNKLENEILTEKQEADIKETIAREKDKRYVAKKKMDAEANQTTVNNNTTISPKVTIKKTVNNTKLL